MLWPTLILSGHAIALSVTTAPKAVKFPSRATPPADVVVAQLDALRRNDVARTYELFSRARRLAIDEAARGDARHYEVSREVVLQKLEIALRESCPGLLGHDRSEICPVPLSAPGTGSWLPAGLPACRKASRRPRRAQGSGVCARVLRAHRIRLAREAPAPRQRACTTC